MRAILTQLGLECQTLPAMHSLIEGVATDFSGVGPASEVSQVIVTSRAPGATAAERIDSRNHVRTLYERSSSRRLGSRATRGGNVCVEGVG